MRQKTRVLFIKYHEAADQQPLSRKAAEKMGIFPSLALGGLAAVLREHGYPVGLVDLHADNLYPVDAAADRVREFAPDVVGLTAKTLGWPAVIEIGQMVRRVAPHALVVLGGPHMSIYPKESLSWDCFDVAVVGDGEETLLELCDRVEQGDEPVDVPGTVVRKPSGEIVENPPRPFASDIDHYPFTAFDLMPMDRYHCLTVLSPLATMVTSRGCPWHCGYCSQVYSEKLRFRSPERVAEEMELLEQRFGVREIIMFDETFTIGKARILALCEQIRRRDLKVRFNIRARVDTVDREMLVALKAAGLRSIHMGVEAGTNRLLGIMRKGITREQTIEAFRVARDVGIETRGYFMIGYYDATKDDIEQTIALATQLGLDWASFSVATALPATDLYEVAQQRGYVEKDFWKRYTIEGGGEIPQLHTELFTADQLRKYRTEAYMRFYLQPDLIRRKLSTSENIGTFLEMADGAYVLSEIVKSTLLKRVPKVGLGRRGTV
jgi:anaerobic magnesium-protoporphyrin IX monomethyl ester cyclase